MTELSAIRLKCQEFFWRALAPTLDQHDRDLRSTEETTLPLSHRELISCNCGLRRGYRARAILQLDALKLESNF